jgi:mono/diheme cytochrome c family protein
VPAPRLSDLQAPQELTEPIDRAGTDAASIVKGQHFVQAIGKCANCHGDNLAGKVVLKDKIMGRLYSANLRRGKAGIGSSFTDRDYVHSVAPKNAGGQLH